MDECVKCGRTVECPARYGWPCTAEQVDAIEQRYYGTSDPSRRGYRSFWD